METIEQKKNSRKWKLVLGILLVTIIGTFIPPIISQWVFKDPKPLVVLSGAHFVTLVTLIVSAYFGANVFQKKVYADKEVKESTIEIESDEEGEA